MSGGTLLVVIALTGLWPPWPFGRDREERPPEPTGTIVDLAHAPAVTVDTETKIDVDEANARTAASYVAFLDLASPDPELRAEAMRRLGDFELEAGEAAELAANAQAVGGAMNDAIELYTELLAAYPDYAKNDFVLYQLARAYEAAGDGEQALATLDVLVMEFPETRHMAEAEFRRGETLFVAQQYADAEAAYVRVLEHGADGPFAEQALYKLGWSRFKQQSHEAAFDPFLGLLDRTLGAAPNADPAAAYAAMGRADQELVDDTLRVLAISFSYLDGPETITAELAARDSRPYARVLYSTLGDLYLEQERYQDAADSYHAFAVEHPLDAEAPLLQAATIEAYELGGFADLVVDAKREFVERYELGAEYWTVNMLDARPEVAAELKSHLADMAAYHHARAQTGAAASLEANAATAPTGEAAGVEANAAPAPPGNDSDTAAGAVAEAAAEAQAGEAMGGGAVAATPALSAAVAADYAAAARWYRAYLAAFPADAEAARTNFLLSEVLFESGAYAAAAVEYERTAYAYPEHAAAGEAAYAALIAHAEHEKALAGEERVAWHRAGIDQALRFAAAFPAHAAAAAVQTDAAEKLFALDEFANARDAAQVVVARVPPAPAELMRTAWTVVAHAEFDLESYAAAENAYTQLMAFVPPEDPQRAEITERLAASVYRQAEQALAVGDTNVAVTHFLRVGVVTPSSPVRATAEYDAAAALIRAGEWRRAADVLEDFRAAYPDHALVADATASLAVAYTQAGDDSRAAREFERIADGVGTEEARREALWRAAGLYEGGADPASAASATAALTRYVERHPTPVAEAIEARERLAVLAAEGNDAAARTRWLGEIIAADASAGAERTTRTTYLAAKAQLELATPTRDAFRDVRLVAPLPASLARKRERMEQALAAYGKAADYGVAEVTTAATYEIAELYNQLGRDLIGSERPAELAAEELEQYDILLEEQAFPFEEQAIEVHEVNAGRTADGVYDEWVKKSLAALAELLPVRYGKEEIGEAYVNAIR